jgi:hypothetical protein
MYLLITVEILSPTHRIYTLPWHISPQESKTNITLQLRKIRTSISMERQIAIHVIPISTTVTEIILGISARVWLHHSMSRNFNSESAPSDVYGFLSAMYPNKISLYSKQVPDRTSSICPAIFLLISITSRYGTYMQHCKCLRKLSLQLHFSVYNIRGPNSTYHSIQDNLVKMLVAAEDLTKLKLNFDEFDESASAMLPLKEYLGSCMYLAAFAASTLLP